MHVWRLMRPDYAPGLDGIGARRVGGRWNSPGRAAVYCASSLSLAALEVFVHLPPGMRTTEKLPRLLAVKLLLPQNSDRTVVGAKDFPADLLTVNFRAIGDAWLAAGKTLVLEVASLVVPYEQNYILNPDHPDMKDVEVIDQLPFEFDPRIAN